MRILKLLLVILALATAMHLDWHVARPAHHHLSLGLRRHWVMAVPVFVLVALYIQRAWPRTRWTAALAVVAVAGFLAAGVEPGWEYWLGDASWDWAFGPARLGIFLSFTATGILSMFAVLLAGRRAGPPSPATDG